MPGSFESGLVWGLLFFLVLRILVRRQALAAALYVLAFVWGSSANSIVEVVAGILIVGLLIHYGLLAVVTVFAVVNYFLAAAPVTPDWSAWYAGTGLICLAVVVALAGYGFTIALAGRPLLGKGWLGEE